MTTIRITKELEKELEKIKRQFRDKFGIKLKNSDLQRVYVETNKGQTLLVTKSKRNNIKIRKGSNL